MQAVDGLGQDPGAGGLAGAPGAGEKVGVARAALSHLTPKGIGDMLLADHLGKGDGPPLAIECLIHGPASLNKSIADFASADAKNSNHFLSRHARERKYRSARKCGIFALCAKIMRAAGCNPLAEKSKIFRQDAGSPPHEATEPAPLRHMNDPS